MGGCDLCRWFLFPTRLAHVYAITLIGIVNEVAYLVMCFALKSNGPMWLAYTGCGRGRGVPLRLARPTAPLHATPRRFGCIGMVGLYSLRGTYAMITQQVEFRGEILFRMYATEVCVGPMGVFVLVLPALWEPVLRRVLDHRRKDGARLEGKEAGLFVFLNLSFVFIAVWTVLVAKKYTPFLKYSMMVCAGTTALSAFPRVVRWGASILWYLQHCLPCCYRLFGRCSFLQVESPYGEGMWGAAATAKAVDPTIVDERTGKVTEEAKVLAATRVFPLAGVIKFELTTDEEKKRSLEAMRNLGKPGSDVPFPDFPSLRVFDQLERGRVGEFSLHMFADKDGSSGGGGGGGNSGGMSPPGAMWDDSPTASPSRRLLSGRQPRRSPLAGSTAVSTPPSAHTASSVVSPVDIDAPVQEVPSQPARASDSHRVRWA